MTDVHLEKTFENELVADLASESAQVRLLVLEERFDDAWIEGHLGRVGLLQASGAGRGALVPAMRQPVRNSTLRR